MNKIDKLFKSALEPYEEAPSIEVWRHIKHKLDERGMKNKQQKYFWFLKIAVCIGALILSLALYEILINKKGLHQVSRMNESPKKQDSSVLSYQDKTAINNNKNNNYIESINANKPGRVEKDADEFKVKINQSDWNFKTKIKTNKQPEHSSFVFRKSDKLSIKRFKDNKKDKSIYIERNKIEKDLVKNEESDRSYNEDKLNTGITQIEYTDTLIFSNKILKILDLISLGSDNSKIYDKTSDSLKETPAFDSFNKKQIAVLRKKIKPDRLSLTTIFSPDITGNRLNQQYEYDNQNQQEISQRENTYLSYTMGLLINYNLSRRWLLESGVTLFNSVTSINPSIVRAQQDGTGKYKFKLATTYGLGEISNTYINNPQSGDSIQLANNSTQQLQYITVPVMLKYQASKGRFDFYTSFGIGINFINKGKIIVEVPYNSNSVKETIPNIEGLKKTFYTGILSVGTAYNISPKIALSFEPTLRYSLTSINQNTPVKDFPYAIGLAGGIKFKF